MLRRAGWSPGRAVPTATWESILRESGAFVPHDAARRFLSEFGGLVTYGWPADTITTSSAIRFDPLAAAWQDERFARASREAGTPLYPVGAADAGAALLGLSEDGALHLLRDRTELLSPTTDQSLDRLVEAQVTASALWKPSGRPPVDHAFWRRLDIWENILLETGGFELHDAACRFLAEFGALRVPYRDPRDAMPWMEFSHRHARPPQPAPDHGGGRRGVRGHGQCQAAGRHTAPGNAAHHQEDPAHDRLKGRARL
ncbi:SUKH-3 domain-containing protein [Streptomyces sp. NPDC058534]|uniref:SUKH-3 domain-containing protein n=1 Tax=Streptomyces sp. NPDC058534 TaxID=3346541 RepID=UPI0036577FD8